MDRNTQSSASLIEVLAIRTKVDIDRKHVRGEAWLSLLPDIFFWL